MSTTTIAPRKSRALPPLMTLTDAAAGRLRSLYDKAEQGKLLRIGVKTKGCSGMSYDMNWVDEPGPGDEVVSDKGLTVLVDRKASLFLIGTVMDYEVKALDVGLHLHQSEREGPLRLRRKFPRLSRLPRPEDAAAALILPPSRFAMRKRGKAWKH